MMLKKKLHKMHGICTSCGARVLMTDLHCLPETEQFFRQLALGNVKPSEISKFNVHTNDLLCPKCMKKALETGKN